MLAQWDYHLPWFPLMHSGIDPARARPLRKQINSCGDSVLDGHCVMGSRREKGVDSRHYAGSVTASGEALPESPVAATNVADDTKCEEPPCSLPSITNAAADVCGSGVAEIADSASCTVACGTGYTASSTTTACAQGDLASFSCDPSPCSLPSVTNALAPASGLCDARCVAESGVDTRSKATEVDAQGQREPHHDLPSVTGLRLVRDVAGPDMPGCAMRYNHCLGSQICWEIDTSALTFLAANHPEESPCGSVMGRDPATCSDCDILVAGFPCQHFSPLGLQQGWGDVGGRGNLIVSALDFVRPWRPPVVILERVAAFCRAHHGSLMQWVIDTQDEFGYVVDHRVLITSKHVLPLTRKRWYLAGLHRGYQPTSLVWPGECRPIPLAAVIGPRPPDASADRCPGHALSLASRNLCAEVGLLRSENIDPQSCDRILDCDASTDWCGRSKRLCPCLTKSCRAGLWDIEHGRRLSGAGCLRLQGLCHGDIAHVVGESDLRALAGNPMSLCVIEPLIRACLVSMRLRSADDEDWWSLRIAQARLVKDAWGPRPPPAIIGVLPDLVARHFWADFIYNTS